MTERAAIPLFDPALGDGQPRFTRVGDGALGGKAAFLIRAHETVLGGLAAEGVQGFDVDVPPMTVLTTDRFDGFVAGAGLASLATGEADDRTIVEAFLRAELPAELAEVLRALTAQGGRPLAVRSSSLLEDQLQHPFAGVYATRMLANDHPDAAVRARQLAQAVKVVWASTWCAEARHYQQSVGKCADDEKMAVIIQRVAGRKHGPRFYPCLSGVARSYHFYARGRARPDQGMVTLALGLGKTIADGAVAWTYSPAHPKAPPPVAGPADLLRKSQTRFWAVHMGRLPSLQADEETQFLTNGGLRDAEADGVLRFLASTYDAAADRLVPGTATRGPRALTFEPILAFRDVPLNDLLVTLLERCRDELGGPVEMEFAVTLDPGRGVPARLHFLQVRPMAVSGAATTLDEPDLAGDDVVVAARRTLGNGQRDDIRDVVFVKPQHFDPMATRQIAHEIERLDRALRDEGRPYLLIGFGRWGSSNPTLGIPVTWSQICGASVIVEANLPTMRPELSQGSHFFQNLISFQVLYLSIAPEDRLAIDWDWLRKQERIEEYAFAKHVRTARPLTVLADGVRGLGVVRR